MAEAALRSRIVRTGTIDLSEVQYNPANWRVHPKPQQDAMAGVLREVGWVTGVIVNERTGNLVDGHLRVMEADKAGATEVPAVFVDLSAEEEALILATFDPISALAVADKEKLGALLHETNTGEAAVQEMLAGLAEREGVVAADSAIGDSEGADAGCRRCPEHCESAPHGR